MNIIRQTAITLQTALGYALDQLGRRTGVIRRQRKFSGATLLQMLVLTLMKKPAAHTHDFTVTAAQLGVVVTDQAVEKRWTDRLVGFLREALDHVLAHACGVPPAAVPLLDRFTAVEISDSTTITLPEDFAAEFPSCGGTGDCPNAALKLQLTWEWRSGALRHLELQAGRDSDTQSQAATAPVAPGTLLLRDLGYFDLELLRQFDAAGAYWITRWQPGTVVRDRQGQRLDLPQRAREHTGPEPLQLSILRGAAAQLPCRLLLLRVPEEIANRRRQQMYAKAQKHGRTPSAESLFWCDWTLLLTNAPEELLSWKEVVILARLRWQIELLFKLWKGHHQLAVMPASASAVQRMALFWAKLIGVVLHHQLLLMSTWMRLDRNLCQAAAVVREWIVRLTEALNDLDRLVASLEKLAAIIQATAKQKRRKKDPCVFQLLLDPELLDWNC